jgi:hypothetical protein
MRAVYSNCGTYLDTCAFSVSSSQGTEPIAIWSQGTLTTRFIRGTALRADQSVSFNDATQPLSYVLHAADAHYTIVQHGPGSESKRYEPRSLEQMVQYTYGSTGLWGAPVQYVASLLFPDEVSHCGLAPLVDPITEALEPIGGLWCLRLRAQLPAGGSLTLWVDRDTWLLQRVSSEQLLGDINRRSTVEFRPSIDVSISPGEVATP